MTVSKQERLKDIANILANNPRTSLQVIGDKYGVSREYIRQIIRKNNLLPPGPKPRPRKYVWKYCAGCGKVLDVHSTRGTCNSCAIIRNTLHYACAVCSNPFTRYKPEVVHHTRNGQKPPEFCSNKCQGINLGQTIGFLKTFGPKQYTSATCEQCGKDYEFYSKSNGIGRFCSRLCWHEFGRITRACNHCGEDYTHVRSQTRQYCSLACVGLSRRKN